MTLSHTSVALLLAIVAWSSTPASATNAYSLSTSFSCNGQTINTADLRAWHFVPEGDFKSREGTQPSCPGAAPSGQSTYWLENSTGTQATEYATTYIKCYGNGDKATSTGTCCGSGAVTIDFGSQALVSC